MVVVVGVKDGRFGFGTQGHALKFAGHGKEEGITGETASKKTEA